jgi:glutaredoxin
MTQDDYVITRGEFDCPWCDKAAALLDQKGVTFTVRKLGMVDLIKHQAAIGHQTVPIITKGSALIGGYSELEASLS